MTTNNEGGQAFPSHPILYSSADAHQAQGMSLRDWFAGQALAGICANGHTPWSPNVADIEDAEVARAAYDLADAMLAARAKGGA